MFSAPHLVPRRLFSSQICCNIPSSISDKIGRGLLLRANHPLNTVKNLISSHLNSIESFKVEDNLHPKVSTLQCFDDLLIPKDHVSRKPSDTFYFDSNQVLRTHTSAHQSQFLSAGISSFLVFGDCYRRDAIDSTHYPVFHQVEGVKVFASGQNLSSAQVLDHLKSTLEGLIRFGIFKDPELKIRWVDAYFPFTNPSLEMEVWYQGEWLEVLGCGVIQPEIIQRHYPDKNAIGWAFGIGLERIAMRLFNIPDIRLFWSEDPRFLSQFTNSEIVQFQPFSKFPACFKDISFWTSNESVFEENDFYSIIRDIGGDLVESVEMVDDFKHPKTGRQSYCFRINYRSMERSLLNSEIDDLQFRIREKVSEDLHLELR